MEKLTTERSHLYYDNNLVVMGSNADDMSIAANCLIRCGSAWHDMPVIIRAILDNDAEERFACLS